MEKLIGQSLNRYKLTNLLGEGGMGAVFKARDVTLQRDVAIKIMHPQFAKRTDFQERFLQEARTAARLDHPGIVEVHDFGQSQNYLYIVMEFIPGDNLGKMLANLSKSQKWVPLPEALELLRQVALALDYAHRQGVLHRDIKPDNVMLKPEPSDRLPYHPVLTDLGLAKLAGGMMTQDGTSMGTPAYMSPEQALGQPTDPRSDVYSLGVLLFELATGRRPFPATTITEAIRFHTQEPPPAPRSIRSDLPEGIEQLILKALEKDPAKRFATAGELAKALEECASTATQVPQATPTALEGAVSLITQYQQSLLEPRGPSVLAEFPQAAEDAHDRIQIMGKDKTIRSQVLKRPAMTIGREAGNDLILDDPKASRQHARIEFADGRYQIIDLDSSNGTYLLNARLLPGVPEPWTPDKGLRIGDTWLRLIPAKASDGDTFIASGDTRLSGQPAPSVRTSTQVDASRVHSSPGPGRVGVFLENLQLSVEPGQSLTFPAVLLNQGATVDHFKLSVAGIPATWVSLPQKPLQLMPGDQQDVAITLLPPRTPQARAGRYPITLSARSTEDPSQVAEVKAALTVAAYSQFSAELYPQKLRAGQTGRVSVKNQGNAHESLQVSWKDRAAELTFSPPQVQLNVPEGQTGMVEFRAQPRQRRWLGREKTHAFSAQVATLQVAAKGEPQVLPGELVSRGLIPPWAPPAALLLCLGIVVLASLLGGGILRGSNSATQTAVAQLTQVAELVVSANQARTLTAEAMLNANQATRDAATATATWLSGDDDRDGITNGKELELNTLPAVRDTDTDGLDDGTEIRQHTDPLNPDSDDDGMKDGEEVSKGLNPNNKDSDGDGIQDNVDTAPGATSTPTPDANATAQAAAQATTAAQQQTQQAASQQTQQAAQQTQQVQSAAQTQTAQAILNVQAATAQAATAAAQSAQAATQTAAAAQLRLAYIFSTNPSIANDFASLLQEKGYIVDLVSQDSILSTNFSIYKGIVIGPETGNLSSWGDSGGSQAQALNNTNLPIMGVGEGGYAFFGRLGLAIGWGNGSHGSNSASIVVDRTDPAWRLRIRILLLDGASVTLYNSSVSTVDIFLSGPVAGVVPVGRSPSSSSHYTIVREGKRFVLWGFNDGPGNMTGSGKDVFTNLVNDKVK